MITDTHVTEVVDGIRDTIATKLPNTQSHVSVVATKEYRLSFGWGWWRKVPQLAITIIFDQTLSSSQCEEIEKIAREWALDELSGPDLYGARIYLEFQRRK